MIYEADGTIATTLAEAYPNRDDLARVLGVETEAQAKAEARYYAERELVSRFDDLVTTLSDDKLGILGDWVEAQFPDEEPVEVTPEPEVETPDFTCTDCGVNKYYPHEGKYLDIHNEDACRCVDCHLKHFVPCDSERCCA
jgi:hypothetical protein